MLILGASWLLATGVAVLLSLCGVSVTDAIAPGETPAPDRCVRQLHPGALLAALVSFGALVAGALQERRVAIVAGGVLLGVGLLFALSTGLALLAVGALTLAGGLVLPSKAPRAAPA